VAATPAAVGTIGVIDPAETLCEVESLRGCEKMGLAPSRHCENTGHLAGREVPVPIFSQPLREVRQRWAEAPTDVVDGVRWRHLANREV
jgi:hypothetical protein